MAVRIIDVDAHFEPAADWLDAFPDLKGRLPERLPTGDPRFALGSAEMFAFFVSDDLLRGVPRVERMPIEDLVTPAMSFMFDPARPDDLVYEGADQYAPLTDPAARVAWMDAHGVEKQNVITGAGYTLARTIDDLALGHEALEAVNTWMADAVADQADRLLPVTSLRFEDLDWAVGEMARMRGRGSRTFVISSEPTAGLPPSHPDFDPVWAAATELGMVPLLHIGMSPSLIHPGWANTDDPGLIRLLSVLQPDQSAQVFLTALVFGGVFERHPALTILLSELGIDWLPRLVGRLDGMAEPGVSPLVLGEYRLPRRPGEYVRDHVRISPLPHPHQSPLRLLEHLPEVAVFSSDYPHFEGNGDPLAHYDQVFDGVDESRRDAFLGGNILSAYERMDDPL